MTDFWRRPTFQDFWQLCKENLVLYFAGTTGKSTEIQRPIKLAWIVSNSSSQKSTNWLMMESKKLGTGKWTLRFIFMESLIRFLPSFLCRFDPKQNNSFCSQFSAKQSCETNNCAWNTVNNFCYLWAARLLLNPKLPESSWVIARHQEAKWARSWPITRTAKSIHDWFDRVT